MRRRLVRRLKRVLYSILYSSLKYVAAPVVLLAFLILVIPQARAGFHTLLFVTETLETPVRPQSWFTREPVRFEAVYGSPDGAEVADVYRLPDGKPRAAVLLSIGAGQAGLGDRSVTNLGYALSRAGFVTMLHWSPDLGRDADLQQEDPDKLVRAFEYLISQDYVDAERAGIGGFSVGGSFAMVAAADPRIRDDVVFINAFGSYFDLETLLVEAASRSVDHDGERTPWKPHSLTMRVLAHELIETVVEPADALVLTGHYLEDMPATPAELQALSQRGRVVVRMLDGVTPQEAEGLYAELPQDFREGLAEISPSSHIADVQARLLVMHDRADRHVPVTESRRLVDVLGDRDDVRYTEFLSFNHTLPGEGGLLDRVGQAFRLSRHMYHLIRIAR